MNNARRNHSIKTQLTFIDVEPSTSRSAVSATRQQSVATKPLLVDVVNPQPRSSKSFYARINGAQQKTQRPGQIGRIKRQSVKKARI